MEVYSLIDYDEAYEKLEKMSDSRYMTILWHNSYTLYFIKSRYCIFVFLNISQPDKGSVALVTLLFTFGIGMIYKVIFAKKIQWHNNRLLVYKLFIENNI
jgi:hypothetical protein